MIALAKTMCVQFKQGLESQKSRAELRKHNL